MTKHNITRMILGALLAASGAQSMAADNSLGEAPALEGVDWQLVQFRAGDTMQDAAASEQSAVLRFDGGRLSGSAGCNRLMGAYHGEGSKLSFEPHIAATMMACPPPLMEQEQAVIDAFGQAASYRINGDTLRIKDADDQTLLTLTRQTGLPLTGTSWRLTWYNNGKQAIVSALKDTEVMLQLRDDGQLAGKACNSYRGGFEQEGDSWRVVGPIAATRMACPEPEGASEQESAYFAALERVARFRINGDELTLTDADGTTQAKFKADGP
jgi:heat shock protein HslJ